MDRHLYSKLINVWGPERAASYAAANLAAIEVVRQLVVGDEFDCELTEVSAYTYTETSDGGSLIEAHSTLPVGPASTPCW